MLPGNGILQQTQPNAMLKFPTLAVTHVLQCSDFQYESLWSRGNSCKAVIFHSTCRTYMISSTGGNSQVSTVHVGQPSLSYDFQQYVKATLTL